MKQKGCFFLKAAFFRYDFILIWRLHVRKKQFKFIIGKDRAVLADIHTAHITFSTFFRYRISCGFQGW